MAKRKGRRRFRRYIRGVLDEQIALGTLGPEDVLTQDSDVVTETAWLSSIKATWALIDFSPGTQDGPLLVGIAHSDYTSTEIEGWIEQAAGASWSQADLIATREVGRRLIKQIGVFTNLGPTAASADALNDGRPITTKCGWPLATGQGVRYWVYNSGTGTLATGAFVHVNGHANIWPR